jgi:plastocyanin
MPNPNRRTWRHLITAVTATPLVLSLVVGGAQAMGPTVLITSTLEPAHVEVLPGTAVMWWNQDAERHRIRSRDGPEEFDSGDLGPGDTFTFTFTLEGTYPYVDHRDDEDAAYFGTIVVTSTPGGLTEPGELPSTGAVTIGDRVFIPPEIELATGGTVEWTNADSDSHTATASEGAFDSGILAPGATFTQTFDTAGIFPFFCEIHPEMQGTITVSDPVADGGAPLEAVSSPAVPDAVTSPAPSPALAAAPSPASSGGPVDVASPGPAASPGASVAPSASVTLADRAFDPTSVEVPVGGSVDWSNLDVEGHTITAVDGSFDSGVVGPGEAYSATFEIAGTYDYLCAIHPEMQATVVVVDRVPATASAWPHAAIAPSPG